MRHLLLNTTWRCQHRCLYCWVEQTVRERGEMYRAPERPVEDWFMALKRDLDIAKKAGDGLLVDIAGGEPLLTPWVLDLMWSFRAHIPFGLSTNGMCTAEIERMASRRIPNIVSVNVSYHPTSQIPDYLSRWKRAVSLLKGAGYPVHPNIVVWGDNLASSGEAMDWMRRAGIGFALSPYERMDSLGEAVDQGLECRGGIDHLNVAPDGMAWPCLTSMRSPYWREFCLGNWLDGTVDQERRIQPCHLRCVDYYTLKDEHEAGDMWGVRAEPTREKQPYPVRDRPRGPYGP